MNWTLRNIMWLNGLRVFGLHAGRGGRFQRFHDRAVARSRGWRRLNRLRRILKIVTISLAIPMFLLAGVNLGFGLKSPADPVIPQLFVVIVDLAVFVWIDLVLVHEGFIKLLVHERLSWEYQRRREGRAVAKRAALDPSRLYAESTPHKLKWPWPYHDVVIRSFLMFAVVATQIYLFAWPFLPESGASATSDGIDYFLLIPAYIMVAILTSVSVYVWSWMRIKSVMKGNFCFSCEYDLGNDKRQAALQVRCPECGVRYPYWNQLRVRCSAESGDDQDSGKVENSTK